MELLKLRLADAQTFAAEVRQQNALAGRRAMQRTDRAMAGGDDRQQPDLS
ncbi:MAG: hypothetical protein KDJ29_06080 [Hyphomicrobiales bacterium]|nr:hypothetical protein [Hyphomicrobiales bacterium]